MTRGIIVVDDGGHSTGVMTKNRQELFPSVKGSYGRRNLTSVAGEYDFIVEYREEKYVMGTLAQFDNRYPIQMHTSSKQNDFYDLSVLVAIHQYGFSENYLIVPVPIDYHTEDEKNGRILRLKGEHTLTVNGISKKFEIVDVKVTPETAVAYWVHEPEGKTRYLDLGSRTIGWATTTNLNGTVRFIDTESGTFKSEGIDALSDDYNPKALADYICGKLLATWNPVDRVFILGGGALDAKLVKYIRDYFENAYVMDDPQMVNTKGMFNLGGAVYGVV